MKKSNGKNFMHISVKLLLLIFTSLEAGNLHAQCDPLVNPIFFGLSRTFIYCKGETISPGVFNSATGQLYNFLFVDSYSTNYSIGGPLDGNGGQLSVNVPMQSARNAGEYQIITYDLCGNVSPPIRYYAFYGSIDNLSISSWGGNSVSFSWAPCGYLGGVTYQYAVTTVSDPNSLAVSYLSTTDTSAVESGLVAGTTYYIHVRVSDATYGSPIPVSVDPSFNCPSTLPASTIFFVSCAGTSSVGTLDPRIGIACNTGSITLTATGGNTYNWYKDATLLIGSTSSQLVTSGSAQYRVYITTAQGCEGMSKTSTITQQTLVSSIFSGGGSFYLGDTVRLGISHTGIGQSYKILKDGVLVQQIQGIGFANESKDTIWYKFPINSEADAGHYSVRTENAACAPIDFGSQDVFVITGVSICPGRDTSFTVPSGGSGYTYQWEVDNGTGFAPIANAAPYSGVTTTKLKITAPPTSLYGNIYRCVATGSGTVISSTRTLKFAVKWTGISSIAWETITNWDCGVLPDANTDVIIPGSALNSPKLSSNRSCRSLSTVAGTVGVTVSGTSVLTITGNPD